jgi:hypothetical protein
MRKFVGIFPHSSSILPRISMYTLLESASMKRGSNKKSVGRVESFVHQELMRHFGALDGLPLDCEAEVK